MYSQFMMHNQENIKLLLMLLTRKDGLNYRMLQVPFVVSFEKVYVPVISLLKVTHIPRAGRSGRAVQGVGLRPLACWYCGFEFRWGH